MPNLARKKIDGSVLERTELHDRPIVFGRSEEADVQVHDERMSRRHFVIAPGDAGSYHLRDMQSTNGTWVNGRRIEEVALKANDKVRAGTTVWVFETEAPQEEATIISGSS